jgi:hypothetical protein
MNIFQKSDLNRFARVQKKLKKTTLKTSIKEIAQ